MTKGSFDRTKRKFVENHPVKKVTNAMSLEAVSNQVTELVALSNLGWAQIYDQTKAGELTSHLLAIQCARFLIQTKEPLKAAEHFHKLVMTHMLGCIPDIERLHGEKHDELRDKLLLAGAIVTQQEKN